MLPDDDTMPLAGIAPATPFIAIGDVHGRADLLAPLLARLRPLGLPVVLLGDYIDHGPDSAGVLRLLQDDSNLTCLRGNHEDLLIRFMHRPRRAGKTWLGYGGRATLASFGISDLPDDPSPDDLLRARDHLHAALGDTLNWIKSMPYLWQSGNVAAIHAGADPHQPLVDQVPKALAWGHPDFGHVQRADGIWCVHGHRIVPKPQVRNSVISIDTGAWKSGHLSAVLISAGELRVL